MVKRPRYKWYWRFCLAGVAYFAVLPVQLLQPTNYLQHGAWVTAEALGILKPTPHAYMGSLIPGGRTFPLPPIWLLRTVAALVVGIALLPGLWAALVVYDWLTFGSRWVDGRTLCGGCGRELRGLTHPCCPKCGALL